TGVDFVGGIHGGDALRARLGRRGRHDVVEESVVFVVGDEEDGLAPDVGVGGQGVENLRDVPGAVIGGPVGMLGVGLGSDNPGDLRKIIVEHVLAEGVEERAGVENIGAGAGFLGKRAVVRGVLILMEVEERVVAVVADVGIITGPAP